VGDNLKNGGSVDDQEKTEITIRSSATECLTFVATTGNDETSIEMRMNIWHTRECLRLCMI